MKLYQFLCLPLGLKLALHNVLHKRMNYIPYHIRTITLQTKQDCNYFNNSKQSYIFSIGKAFEITYIRLKFYTSRPESFAIYRRTEEDEPWLPYQYYSGSCKKTYKKDPRGYIRPGDDERTALCTDEFSDISPLTGGNVAFSTLEGRPSAYNFDQSLALQVSMLFVLCYTLKDLCVHPLTYFY